MPEALSPTVKANVPQAQSALRKMDATRVISVVSFLALSVTAAWPAAQKFIEAAPPFIPPWVTYAVALVVMVGNIAVGAFAHFAKKDTTGAVNTAADMAPPDSNYS